MSESILSAPVPIPFSAELAPANWIEVVIGVGPCDEPRAVLAQVSFVGRSADGDVGFVARDEQGIVYRGALDTEGPRGPCYVALFTSTGSPAVAIAHHRRIFSPPPRASTPARVCETATL